MLLRRATVTLAVVLSALFGFACKEGKSPTEPAAIVATPTPGPTPTPTPVLQPASMSGKVRWYGGAPVPSATVSCQQKSATAAADGSYSLSELHSGETDVIVDYSHVTDKGETVTEQLLQRVTLKPGENSTDFWVY
jgi:hypothetical protein